MPVLQVAAYISSKPYNPDTLKAETPSAPRPNAPEPSGGSATRKGSGKPPAAAAPSPQESIRAQRDILFPTLAGADAISKHAPLPEKSALTPSTVATELAINNKLTDGNPEKVMQPEDIAEFIIAQLKLNRRIFIKEAGLWSTNP